jgi:hypothetical protein
VIVGPPQLIRYNAKESDAEVRSVMGANVDGPDCAVGGAVGRNVGALVG